MIYIDYIHSQTLNKDRGLTDGFFLSGASCIGIYSLFVSLRGEPAYVIHTQGFHQNIYIKDCFLNKNNDVCMNGTKEIKDVSDARGHHFLRL